MKILKAVVLILAFVSLAVFSPDAEAQDKPGKPVIRKITVQGNKPWTPTGVLVRPGDTIIVEATGKVYFSNGDPVSEVGPAGYLGDYIDDFPVDATELGMSAEEGYGDPIPGENHAALIVSIGDDLMGLGAGKEFSGHEGEIIFGINDCTFVGSCYNTGAFTVTITMKRAKDLKFPRSGSGSSGF